MKKDNTTKHLFYALCGIIILVVLTRGITYAKYVSDAAFNYYLSSKGFYFESDELSSEQSKITDTSWGHIHRKRDIRQQTRHLSDRIRQELFSTAFYRKECQTAFRMPCPPYPCRKGGKQACRKEWFFQRSPRSPLPLPWCKGSRMAQFSQAGPFRKIRDSRSS